MHRAWCLLFAALATTAAVAAAPDQPLKFRWQRTIELPPLNGTAVVSVPFDSHVFAGTRDGFPDLRMRHSDGGAASFLIRQAPNTEAKTVRSSWIARQTGVRLLETGGLQVELQVADDAPLPTGLQIVTPLRDFELQVRVESSADGENWMPAGSPALIFDYSRYIDARHLEIPVATTVRRLRLTIEDVSAEQESQLLELSRRLRGGAETKRTERTTIQRRPFRIDYIQFLRDDEKVQTRSVQTAAYPASEFKVRDEPKKQQTIVTFTTRREPISEIRVVTEASNFSRAAVVETGATVTGGAIEWRPIGMGTLTRFALGSLAKDECVLHVGEARSERFRVVIENRDSPPLPITGVELAGPVYEAVFLAAPGDALLLAYGSAEAAPGQFDTAALQASLSEGANPIAAKLSTPQEDPSVPTAPAWTPWNDPLVLVLGILLLTVILGFGLFAASRRVDLNDHSPHRED